MITIFTTTKPFNWHNKIIQINAIQSWLLLRPECEIIIFGNEEGTAEIASKLGVRHVPDIECNEYGTPLGSSIFASAQALSGNQLLCYVNADIILMNDFLSAVQRVNRQKFLMVGQRWDLDLNELLDFKDVEWEFRLRTRVAEYGQLHPKTGIDYFVYSKGLYDNIPPFAIGRTAWDNWLIYRARTMKIPVIDATKAITVVHQNHDYSHHPMGKEGVWQGAEARQNRALAGGYNCIFNIHDANWSLSKNGVSRASPLKHFYQQSLRLSGSLLRLLKRSKPL